MKNHVPLVLLLAGCAPQPSIGEGREAVGTETPPIGGLESVDSSGTARGWTLDPNSPAAALQVQLYVDGDAGAGAALAPATANLPRADVNQSTGFAGDHGFALALPQPLHDGHPHALYAYAVDADTGVPARLALTFTLAAPTPASSATATCSARAPAAPAPATAATASAARSTSSARKPLRFADLKPFSRWSARACPPSRAARAAARR